MLARKRRKSGEQSETELSFEVSLKQARVDVCESSNRTKPIVLILFSSERITYASEPIEARSVRVRKCKFFQTH